LNRSFGGGFWGFDFFAVLHLLAAVEGSYCTLPNCLTNHTLSGGSEGMLSSATTRLVTRVAKSWWPALASRPSVLGFSSSSSSSGSSDATGGTAEAAGAVNDQAAESTTKQSTDKLVV